MFVRMSLNLFSVLYVCARVSVLDFVFLGVIRSKGPARRVNLLGDATPFVQCRPARESDRQTQTDTRRTITKTLWTFLSLS